MVEDLVDLVAALIGLQKLVSPRPSRSYRDSPAQLGRASS
jgi:hypothetical protein